jgi:glyoxylase-like metal-dependent hydrolase (beta-lactamase superfamily II)
VYSHGHIDHVFGVPVWAAESSNAGWPAPEVVAHEALPARFDRYILTAGYNAIVNRRQFDLETLQWPTEYRYPDRTYRDHLELDIGGMRAELHHAKGETDDHTWTWLPERRVLCCGDLFIWASPNAGNPQKVQRYPAEWAAALREMLALYDSPGGGPEVLLPGHGYPTLLWMKSRLFDGFSEVKTADKPMMGHSMQRASSYQVTRLGELGEPEPWTGRSVTGQS